MIIMTPFAGITEVPAAYERIYSGRRDNPDKARSANENAPAMKLSGKNICLIQGDVN
jgi:hypothetical protein